MRLAALALLALLPALGTGAPGWSPAGGALRVLVAADEAPEMFALVAVTRKPKLLDSQRE